MLYLEFALLIVYIPERKRDSSPSPRQCREEPGLNSGSFLNLRSGESCIHGLPRLFSSHGQHTVARAVLSPWPLNRNPESGCTLCCHLPPQEPCCPSPDPDSRPRRGFPGLPRPQGVSAADCKCRVGCSCSPKDGKYPKRPCPCSRLCICH